MPYFHERCGGPVGFWSRKCKKCKRSWPITSYLLMTLPKGMTWQPKPPKMKEKGTKYAKWADRVPGVTGVASRLPNWPRWARILGGLVIVGVLFILVYLLVRWRRGL